jgi:hypothetical protein
MACRGTALLLEDYSTDFQPISLRYILISFHLGRPGLLQSCRANDNDDPSIYSQVIQVVFSIQVFQPKFSLVFPLDANFVHDVITLITFGEKYTF